MNDSAINNPERLQTALLSRDWQVLDLCAWELIRDWPKHTNQATKIDGWDFGLLTRSFLWDKVGRALRVAADPQGSALEKQLLMNSKPTGQGPSRSVQDKVRQRVRRILQQQRKRDTDCRRIFFPAPSERLEAAAQALSLVPDAVITSGLNHRHLFASAVTVPAPGTAEPLPEGSAARIVQAVVGGLAAQGLLLLSTDRDTLAQEIAEQVAHLPLAEAIVSAAAPDLLIVHADNHPQLQHFVFAAKRLRVPTLLLQHGLDCERHYLDDTFCDHVAVWGEERAERYRAQSSLQPRDIAITGNPAFDTLKYPGQVSGKGDLWVWATRPHAPHKCYSPSRRPDEGPAILNALLDALAQCPKRRLIIKCHPCDTRAVYADVIARHPAKGRVRFSSAPLGNLFRRARLAVAEDSTAGLEAMFTGTPLIHAHLAPSTPAMPFVDMNAALPGFDAKQIVASVLQADTLDPRVLGDMHAGQTAFIARFAGPDDGNAGGRLRDYVTQILGARKR